MDSSQSRRRITPAGVLLIIAAILVIEALITAPIINGLPATYRTNNVLVTGIPFMSVFVALVLAFIVLIHNLAIRLNGRISARLHGFVEALLIGGVVVGGIGMFQPWAIEGYQIGFHILLVCFIMFNVWTHITPRAEKRAARAEKQVQ